MSNRVGSTSSVTVGSTVSWQSGTNRRSGRVVKVVHAGRGSAAAARTFIREAVITGQARSTVQARADRRETSFVVLVAAEGRGKPVLFWPRASELCTGLASPRAA